MIQGIDWSSVDAQWKSRTKIEPNLSPGRRTDAGDWAYFDPWTSRFITAAEAKALRVVPGPHAPRAICNAGPANATDGRPAPPITLQAVAVETPIPRPSTPGPIVTTPAASPRRRNVQDPRPPFGTSVGVGDFESVRNLLLDAGVPRSEVGSSMEDVRNM